MKYLLLLLLIVFSIQAFSQRPVVQQPDYYVDYEIIHFQECTDKVHLYANVKPVKFKDVNLAGHTFEVGLVSNDVENIYQVNSEGDIEIFNLSPIDNTVELKFREFDSSRSLVREDVLSYSTLSSPGIVKTTKRIDRYLTEFTDKSIVPPGTSLPYFFCNKRVAKVELLAFFKDYLELSTSEMCEIIEEYNRVHTDFYSSTTDYKWFIELCDWFDEFVTGSVVVTSSCKCKLIETTSAAVNHTATKSACDNPLDETNDCLNFEPIPFQKNYANNSGWGDHDNELQYNEMRMGAAKGAAHLSFFDGLDVSPDPFSIGVRPAISELTYNLVCVDPNTLSVNIDSCEACVKHITFKYLYNSDLEAKATRGMNNLLNKHSAYMNIQDYAILILQNGEEVEIDTGAWSMRVECLTNDNADTLHARAIKDGAKIAQDVIDFAKDLTGATIASAAELAIGVINFAQQNLLEGGCNDTQVDNKTLLGGEKVITLEPGNKFTATMIGGASFSSYIKKKGEAFGMVNSTFFMAGVLLSDQAAAKEDYCECEKVGSYVIGTVEEFPAPIPSDRDGEDDFNIDWANLYNNPSIPRVVLESFVGTFIGVTGGDWEGKFTYTCGGCDIVEIPCYADCAYVRGCGDEEVEVNELIVPNNEYTDQSRLLEKEVFKKVVTSHERSESDEEWKRKAAKLTSNDLTIYPNPTTGVVNLKISGHIEMKSEIQVLDMMGQVRLKSVTKHHTDHLEFDLNQLEAGQYLIIILSPDQEVISKRIIKI